MTCCPAKNKEELHQHIVGMARAEFVYKPLQFLLWIRQGMEMSPRSSPPSEATFSGSTEVV